MNGTAAVVGADRSAVGAVYKGLAIANDRLYATDFHNGRVDVFDESFKLVHGRLQGPEDPEGLRAVRDPGARREHLRHLREAGCGEEGRRRAARAGIRRRVHADGRARRAGRQLQKKNAPLNAPWGLALAPADFSVFGGDLLVGNFGNGRISAYTQRGAKWVYKGQLRHADGSPIEIDGLWAIAFGNGSAAGPAGTLYFLSGPGQEAHGLFGSITAG